MASRLVILALVVALAGCGPKPEEASPALWRIDGPRGERAWLFGTIHALDRPALWRSRQVNAALAGADRIVVEVDNLDDDAAMSQAFAKLAASPDLPPLSQRVAAWRRGALAALLKRGGMKESQFARTETWAAALMLARIGGEAIDPAYGVDRAVIKAAGKKPVIELEGAERQLGVFDTLPEREQRDLLAAVVEDGSARVDEDANLARAWRNGDLDAIDKETRQGILADPELREALFTGRNRDWTRQIVAMLSRGEKPFVAVGAAHMAGGEGLPAMLEARGLNVTRVQ